MNMDPFDNQLVKAKGGLLETKYDKTKSFQVVRPASLLNPKNNAVLFVTEGFMQYWKAVLTVEECIVIWPENQPVPEELAKKHAVILSKEPRYGFAQFFIKSCDL